MEVPVRTFIHRCLAAYAVITVAFAASCAIMPKTVQIPAIPPSPPSYLFTPPPAPEAPAHLFDGVVAVYNNNSMGSGFVVWKDTRRVWVMTALHVVDEHIGRDSLPTINGQPATIHAIAPQHDLAILILPNDEYYGKVLTFAETSIGEEVVAVGFSRWMGREVQLAHFGWVVSTSFLNWRGSWTVTHNAGVRGGLSGGPLLNTDGEVVGVASFFADKGLRVDEANSSEVCSIPGVTAQFFLNMALPCTRPPAERTTH
jgi:S1-C subfamily serine protease